MLAGINWDDVTVATAFVLGAVLATIATIRIMRAISSLFREEREKDRHSRGEP